MPDVTVIVPLLVTAAEKEKQRRCVKRDEDESSETSTYLLEST